MYLYIYVYIHIYIYTIKRHLRRGMPRCRTFIVCVRVCMPVLCLYGHVFMYVRTCIYPPKLYNTKHLRRGIPPLRTLEKAAFIEILVPKLCTDRDTVYVYVCVYVYKEICMHVVMQDLLRSWYPKCVIDALCTCIRTCAYMYMNRLYAWLFGDLMRCQLDHHSYYCRCACVCVRT